MAELAKKLLDVQKKLKAPKGQYNSFGKYNYRSCEDILESVKPLLGESGLTLIITDDISMIGDRYYVKATAILYDSDGENIRNTAFAREPDNKKGLDTSQITGTASSYARKYALNGLFLIDDTKDADTDEYHETTTRGKEPKNEVKKATYGQVQVLSQRYTGANLKHLLEVNHVSSIDELSMEKASELIQRLNSMQNEK